jgi:hypothetical protein
MITGYNTDVAHRGQVLHVQTEDKGVETAWIESLVYAGGQILARKRSSYKPLLDQGRGRTAISELMDRQHRLVIAEVRRGRFDAKLADMAPARPEAAPASTVVAEAAAVAEQAAESPGPEPAEAGPSLDQVILEYLNSEAEQEQLVLVMDVEGDVRLGQRAELILSARSSIGSKPIAGVEVAARLISTVDGPATLGVGKTDQAGLLRLGINLPDLRQGTAALIVSASSELGGAEIKQLL